MATQVLLRDRIIKSYILLRTHLSQTITLPNLRRQYERTPIIPAIKIRKHSRRPSRLVFMHEMASIGKYLHLKLALHLADLNMICQNNLVRSKTEYKVGFCLGRMTLTVRSLSSRSVPASNNNLAGPGVLRNFEERPVNQDGQYGFVALRSVNQVYAVENGSSCLSNAGTETQADRVFRIVRLRMCHSIAEGRDGKDLGRELR